MSKQKHHRPSFELIARPQQELELLLREHMDVLASHCNQYDNDKRHFAAEIALNLRVLLSDTPGSENRSLLHQLGREGQSFFDTERTMAGGDPNIFTAPAGGLVFSRIALEDGKLTQDWSAHLSIHHQSPIISTHYKAWWEKSILHTATGAEFSRRRLVRQMANQDRGGHVAPGIEKAYFELTRGDALGYQQHLIEGDAVTNSNEPIHPSRVHDVSRVSSGQRIARALIRQVAHEVLITLSPECDAYLQTIQPPPPSLGLAMFIQCSKGKPTSS